MQELIDKLKNAVGLTEDQAQKAVQTVTGFVKEKFPMLEGALGKLTGDATTGAATENISANADGDSGIMDKAGDMLGQAKDKLGDLTEGAGEKLGDLADKAQDMAGDAIDKLKGLFGK